MAAYTIIFFVLIISIGGIMAISYSVPVNEIIDFINTAISNGDVSKTFVSFWSFSIGLLKASPILILLAAAIWAIVKAIQRRDGGQEAEASSFGQGVFVFFIGIMISIALFVSLIYSAERILVAFETTTISSYGTAYDVPAPWNMGYTDALFWMNLLYIVGILPEVLGTFILFISTIRTQTYDVYSDTSQSDYSPYANSSIPIVPQEVYYKGGKF